MKKYLCLLPALLLAPLSQALGAGPPFQVPNGHYEGAGTWSDANGSSGTLKDVVDYDNGVWTETATYSDGRVIQGTVTFTVAANSSYTVSVEFAGQSYVIGYGGCSQSQCSTAEATPVRNVTEVASYSGLGLLRHGSYQDLTTGVWTFYDLLEPRTR